MLPYKFTSARFNQPLPRHPSASLSHPPLPKPLKRFSKYLEVVHNLPQSEDHIFTKPMRFHPRPGRSCVAKRTQTEAKDCRYKASADCLAHYCESALNYSHKISGRTAHSPKERRVLTEMTPTKVVLKKPRGRGKSFLMHNFNKTKLCQVR